MYWAPTMLGTLHMQIFNPHTNSKDRETSNNNKLTRSAIFFLGAQMFLVPSAHSALQELPSAEEKRSLKVTPHSQSNLDPTSGHCRDIKAQLSSPNWRLRWKTTPASELLHSQLKPLLRMNCSPNSPSTCCCCLVPHSWCSSEYFLIKFLHTDLCLRVFFPGISANNS